MTVGRLNTLLDELSAVPAATRKDKQKRLEQESQRRPVAKASQRKDRQGEIIRSLITSTSEHEMRHITTMILGLDHKIASSLKGFLTQMHPDGIEVHELCVSVEKVCEKCKDPSQRVVPEVVVGQKFMLQKALAPDTKQQRAQRLLSTNPQQKVVDFLMKKLYPASDSAPRDFVSEAKFDGWRICIHVGDTSDINSISFYSRSTMDQNFGEKYRFDVLRPAILAQTTCRNVILDGEVCPFNKRTGTFTPFPALKSVFWAAHEHRGAGQRIEVAPEDRRGDGKAGGSEADDGAGDDGPADDDGRSDKQKKREEKEASFLKTLLATLLPEDLEIIFIAFDIVYLDDQNLAALPLRERHQKLRSALRDAPEEGTILEDGKTAITGRVALLLPDLSKPLVPNVPSSQLWSRRGSTTSDLKAAVELAAQLDMEGVVVKRLDAPYRFGRSNMKDTSWFKWKRDYATDSWEVDVLIVGGWYGNDGVSGGITKFLCALKCDDSDPQRQFATFCRVYTGLQRDDRAAVNARLTPLLVPVEKRNGRIVQDRNAIPQWLRVPEAAFEWPDVWINDYRESVVLTVKGDPRLEYSRRHATDTALRFPRIERVRDLGDKDWSGVETMAKLRSVIETGIKKDTDRDGKGMGVRKMRTRSAKVMSMFALPNVDDTAPVCDALKGRHVHVLHRSFVNREERGQIAALVAKLGGKETFSVIASRNPPDLVIAGNAPRAQYAAALRAHTHKLGTSYDVMHVAWLSRCLQIQQLGDPQPADFVHLSDQTLLKLSETAGFDLYGSDMYTEMDLDDVRFLLMEQVPRALEVWETRCRVQLMGKTRKAEREALQKELYAPIALPDATVARVAKSIAKQSGNSSGGGGGGAASIRLLGSNVLLLQPHRVSAGLKPGTSASAPSTSTIAGMWAGVVFHAGGEVAPESPGLEAFPGVASSTSADKAAITHVVLLPQNSEACLHALYTQQARKRHQPKLDEQLRMRLLLGMMSWTPRALAEALTNAFTDPAALGVLLDAIAHGRAALASFAALLPASCHLSDAEALVATSLSAPLDEATAAPVSNEAMRTWLLDLPWPEELSRRAARSALHRQKEKRRSAPQKRKRARGGAAAAKDILGSSDDEENGSEESEEVAPPPKRPERQRPTRRAPPTRPTKQQQQQQQDAVPAAREPSPVRQPSPARRASPVRQRSPVRAQATAAQVDPDTGPSQRRDGGRKRTRQLLDEFFADVKPGEEAAGGAVTYAAGTQGNTSRERQRQDSSSSDSEQPAPRCGRQAANAAAGRTQHDAVRSSVQPSSQVTRTAEVPRVSSTGPSTQPGAGQGHAAGPSQGSARGSPKPPIKGGLLARVAALIADSDSDSD